MYYGGCWSQIKRGKRNMVRKIERERGIKGKCKRSAGEEEGRKGNGKKNKVGK